VKIRIARRIKIKKILTIEEIDKTELIQIKKFKNEYILKVKIPQSAFVSPYFTIQQHLPLLLIFESAPFSSFFYLFNFLIP
jgi:hypothetical protein